MRQICGNFLAKGVPENPYPALLSTLEEIPKRFVAISNTYKALPFTWNDLDCCLQSVSIKSLLKIRHRFILACAYLVAIYTQAYLSWNLLDFPTKIFLIYVYACCLLGLVLVYADLKHGDLICSLTRAMHTYNKVLVRILPLPDCTAALKTLKVFNLFYYLLAMCISMPFISHVSIPLTPCIPFFVGNWLLPECSTQNNISFVTNSYLSFLLIVIMFSFGAWNWTIINVHYIFQFYLNCFCGVTFRIYVETYWR